MGFPSPAVPNERTAGDLLRLAFAPPSSMRVCRYDVPLAGGWGALAMLADTLDAPPVMGRFRRDARCTSNTAHSLVGMTGGDGGVVGVGGLGGLGTVGAEEASVVLPSVNDEGAGSRDCWSGVGSSSSSVPSSSADDDVAEDSSRVASTISDSIEDPTTRCDFLHA